MDNSIITASSTIFRFFLNNYHYTDVYISINIIKGTLSEYKGKRENNLNTPAKLSKLEKDVSNQIEREIRNFIQKTIEQNIDPIGLSENFRKNYHGQWTNELTDKILKKSRN